jgi:hypothetical protein
MARSPATSSQMSTAMMSAPSSAKRMAWLRPWPCAAPVKKGDLAFHSSRHGPAPLLLVAHFLLLNPASTGSVTPVT